MNRNLLSAAALAVAFAVSAVLIGCTATGGKDAVPAAVESGLASTLREMGGAPAALAVAEPMRPFFAAGLGFIVLGGLTVCFGGRGAGFLLLGLGVATTATGVLFVQYPWAVLILALAAGLTAALAVADRLRTGKELGQSREALAATAEVIQNIPEGRAIKAGLTALGREVEAKVRAVIDPIKDRLRREGRIGE